jgi:hypothetical protein
MRSARPDRPLLARLLLALALLARALLALALLAGLMAPQVAAARRAPPLPPLPPLELPAVAPLIDAEIAGQAVRLTVDFGGDDIVQINPGSPIAALLAGDARADAVDRGLYRVAVGQAWLAIPFSRETLLIGGRALPARVLRPRAAPAGQPPGSDGSIGLPLLPHASIRLHRRAATAQDAQVELLARRGRSDALGFDWRLTGGDKLDVELHPQRPASVASAVAASLLAKMGNGHLDGPVRRMAIAFGVARPVRRLLLDTPVKIAGLPLRRVEVRLFDWAGKAELPPEADSENAALTVVGRRGRQRGWPVLKLGGDVLDACASIAWQRQPARWQLVCPTD